MSRCKSWDDYPAPIRDESTGCLRWQGPHHSHGYGVLGARSYAHRVAYERAVGPIPAGLTIDHVWDRGCRWRDCVEPSHLEPVPRGENTLRRLDMVQRIAQTHCKRGHLMEGRNVLPRQRNGRRDCRACHNIRQNDRRAAARKVPAHV